MLKSWLGAKEILLVETKDGETVRYLLLVVEARTVGAGGGGMLGNRGGELAAGARPVG